MLIDCHVHAHSKERVKELTGCMKKNKIDKSVLMYWPSLCGVKVPPFRDVLDNIQKHPGLHICGSVRITDAKSFEMQYKEIESALSREVAVGVKLYPGYEHFFANDERCDRIYELCIQHDVPVIYHSGNTLKLKNTIVRYSNPLYIDDVAAKYPKLKAIIAHIGNPCWIDETAEMIYKNKNVFADISGILSCSGKRNTYNENIRRHVAELAAYCGTPRKLLFGSDFPQGRQDMYIRFLDNFKEFSKKDLEYIKYKNAERLFGI